MSFKSQPSTMAGFVPKQALALTTGPNKVTTYETTGGAVTADFAANNLTLIPKMPEGSIIHDNACGAGTVTRKILSSGPPPNIKIHATDIDQVFLDALEQDTKEHAWPVEVTNQRSEALPFPDNTFTHSITNVGIFFTTNAGLDGAKEIYRTLKPGGIAIANCWEHVTWLFPMKAVHDAVRPGAPFPLPSTNWSDGQHLQKIMKEAGFEEGKMRVEKSETWAKTGNLRKWAELTWAFLAGVGKWQESDEERWEEAVDLLVEKLEGLSEAQGMKKVDGEMWLRASQWVVVATK